MDGTLLGKKYDLMKESGGGGGGGDAEDVTYDNTESGLTATNVQAAIDEMVSNFGDGVDEVYNACVSAGSTPASKSPADIASAIGSIGGGSGTITKVYSHTGEGRDISISQNINVSEDGYVVVVGYAYVNDASVKVNSGSNLLAELTTYYFGSSTASIAQVNASDVVSYVATGTGNCDDQIDIYLISNVTMSNSNSNTRKKRVSKK